MAVPLFTLDNDILSVAQDAFDTLIIELGKPCRLHYPGLPTYCPNCVFDTVSQKSSGVYQQGGPTAFPRGMICPMCEGRGMKIVEQTETITMLCNFQPKEAYIRSIIGDLNRLNIKSLEGLCFTKGFLTDYPKVKKCTEAVLATNVEPYMRNIYELVYDPVDNNSIVQARYFMALWSKRG